MTMARRLLVVVMAAAGLLALLVAAVLVALQTDWGRGQVRGIAERQASAALGAEVTIARIGGSLLYGTTIDGLTITLAGETVVTADRVSARYDAFDLLRGAFALDEIVMEGPVVHGGALALLGAEAPGDPPPDARRFAIGRIEVRNGVVLVGPDPADVGGFEIPDAIRDLHAELSLTIDAQTTTISIARLSFVGEAPAVRLERLSGTITIDAHDLVLDDIDVQLAESSMTLRGTIANFRNLGGTDGAHDAIDDGGSAVVVRRP